MDSHRRQVLGEEYDQTSEFLPILIEGCFGGKSTIESSLRLPFFGYYIESLNHLVIKKVRF